MAASDFNKTALDQIETLKSAFGVSKNADVISKALALAQLVAAQADENQTVVLAGKDNRPIRLSLTA